MADKDRIDRELADAGWVPDGIFSEHLAIGESGDLYTLVHCSTWETDEPLHLFLPSSYIEASVVPSLCFAP